MRGLVGSGVRGVSECGEAAMAVLMGLMCCMESMPDAVVVVACTYRFFSTNDVQHSPSRDDLCDISQSHTLFAVSCRA